MDYGETMKILRRLAVEAGEKIMEIFKADEMEVRHKSDESPVTLADELADEIITRGLEEAFPGAMIVTEENAASHQLKGKDFFIVDPLDGTKEFVRRSGEFTVNIAWVESGMPRLGVVHAPAVGRMFRTLAEGGAVEEEGPFEADREGRVRPIHVRKPDNDALIVVASKSHRDKATDEYISRYRVAEMRSAGSSLKFCLVAAGEADLYPRLGRTMEWDTAAGHAVLAAAGGKVVRFDNLTPLAYGKPGFENPFFIAHAPGVELVRGVE